MNTITLATLMVIGNEWIKGDHHRIYFNNATALMNIAGFKVSHYGTGNIKSAFDVDGDKISNTKASKLSSQLNGSFFDVKKGAFSVENEVTKNIQLQQVESKKDKKAVMTRAWVIAKEAQAKFGGKASQYLSGALKAAWAE